MSCPPISRSCISVPMVLTTSNPASAVSAPPQASVEYQPIELPVAATTRTPDSARKSPKVAA